MALYADLTNLADVLKNVYGEGLTNQFNDEKVTYNMFQKSERKPGGNGYVFGIRKSRNQSTGARAESKKLPDPQTGTKDQGTITPKYLYGSIRITGPAIEKAKGNQAAFVDSLADEIDDIYQSIVVDMNRMCHWDGFGQLGRTSAALTTVPASSYAVTFDNDIGIMYMNEGQAFDFYASAGDTIPGATASAVHGQRILTITPSTKVVVVTNGTDFTANHPYASAYTNAVGLSTLAAGAIAVKMGARDLAWASADTPVELIGLDAIFDDGTNLDTFEGIDADAIPVWRSNVISNSSVNRELSIDLMLNACDLTRTRSGQKVSKILMGLGQRRKYANLLLPDVRFAPTVLKGGYETLSFSGGDGSLEIVIDPMCQPNRIYFMPDGIVQKYELTPLGWGNLDNSQLHQRASYDEWDAFLRIYTNLGCEQRNNLTLLKDLTEPSLY
uniref:Putative capsid protein n=1 Tax=viral metagenome TaxID=1070528 RepID=A0A6M3LBV7_9ZZZZ